MSASTPERPHAGSPFGGMKHSGFGREGGVERLEEFCEIQTMVTG